MVTTTRRGARSVQTPVLYLSTFLLAGAVLFWLLGGISDNGDNGNMGGVDRLYHLESVTGYFMQDAPTTHAASFDYTKHNLGLIKRAYDSDGESEAAELTDWQRFGHYLSHLRASAPEGTSYRLLIVGRHGEGDHNVAEHFYGTKAWDDHWSKLEGNGTVIWADAHLTELGKHQARDASLFLKHQFHVQKMPEPGTAYVSPLYRCLQTAGHTYTGLLRDFRPMIMENLREVMGEHTCDRRSNRTFIHDAFPEWPTQWGFTEEDELWQADHRETHGEHDIRTTQLFEEIFEHDGSAIISLTSHSGAIASMLRVLGHREFRLPTGALIPLFVKATKLR